MNFQEIFENNKNIAVVGMSTNAYKAAHTVPMFMSKMGYHVIPVNPMAEEIKGLKSYKNLAEVPDNIDIVNVFRPSEDAEQVVIEAIERHKNKGDVKIIWLQEGIFTENGKKLAEENGVVYIEDVCMYKAYPSNM